MKLYPGNYQASFTLRISNFSMGTIQNSKEEQKKERKKEIINELSSFLHIANSKFPHGN